ncbi:hypothetical protein AVEN_179312-1, partial [Araneus ventricosus]
DQSLKPNSPGMEPKRYGFQNKIQEAEKVSERVSVTFCFVDTFYRVGISGSETTRRPSISQVLGAGTVFLFFFPGD